MWPKYLCVILALAGTSMAAIPAAQPTTAPMPGAPTDLAESEHTRMSGTVEERNAVIRKLREEPGAPRHTQFRFVSLYVSSVFILLADQSKIDLDLRWDV